MGTLDESEYTCPFRFLPKRNDMVGTTLNFNCVGMPAAETRYGKWAHERACLGRFFAVTMAKQVLRAYHKA